MRLLNRRRTMRVVAIFAAVLFCDSARAQTAEEYEVIDAARAAREKGDLALALRYLDALVQHSPELPNAYYNRAITRRAANDNAGARQDLDRTIQLNPQWSGAYGIRAHMRMDAHDYAGAIEDAIAYGNSSEQVELRGYARIALGRHAEALEDFTFLRSGRFGTYTNARYPFALCLLALGRTADAVEWFKTDYADGGNVDARYLLNLGYCLLGRYEEAERDLADWVAERAANPAEIPEYDRAQRANLRDNIDSAYYLLSAVRFAQQDFAGSAAALDKIPESSPLNDDAQLLRHLTLLRTKQSVPEQTSEKLSGGWPQVVDGFLRSKISEKELLAKTAESTDAAERRGQQCQAAFYAGQKRLIAGDELAATLLFEKSVATGKVEFVEYTLAKIALQPR